MTGKPRGYGCRKCSRGECQFIFGRPALLVRMSVSCFLNALQDAGKVLIAAEDDCGGLSSPPAQIPKQLIDRLRERPRTAPKLTFGNEDVASVDPDKDVSLAGEIKSKC